MLLSAAGSGDRIGKTISWCSSPENGAHQKDVGLIVAVLGEEDALGLFLDFVGPTILGGQGEAIRKLHNGTNLEGNLAAVSTDLLRPFS